MGGTRVVERGQRTEKFQARVGDLLHIGDRAQELADAAVRQRFTLQGHDHIIGGGQTIEREHTQ